MIDIDGSVKLSFLFPAPPSQAFEYYGDMVRVAGYMPHIDLVDENGDGAYRMLFDTVEMGTYNIRIYYDVRMECDHDDLALAVRPTAIPPQVEPHAGVNDTTGHGEFFTDATFRSEGDKTRIIFTMRLNARLPSPKSMRFVPGRVARKMAANFTDKRLEEIAVGFVNRSLADYPTYRDQVFAD